MRFLPRIVLAINSPKNGNRDGDKIVFTIIFTCATAGFHLSYFYPKLRAPYSLTPVRILGLGSTQKSRIGDVRRRYSV